LGFGHIKVEAESQINLQLTGKISLSASPQVCFENTAVSLKLAQIIKLKAECISDN